MKEKITPLHRIKLGVTLPELLRMRAIDISIAHYGYCNRDYLADLNSVSIATVSRDIKKYKELNDTVYYNRETKRIEKTSLFERIF